MRHSRCALIALVLMLGVSACGEDQAVEGPKTKADAGGDGGGGALDVATNDAATNDAAANDIATGDAFVADAGVDSAELDVDASDGDGFDGTDDTDGGAAKGVVCAACANDGDCAAKSACVTLVDGKRCLPKCDDDGDCDALGPWSGSFACGVVDSLKVCAPTPGPDAPAVAEGSCGCPGKPAGKEACNGQDDDCDGKTDEDFCQDDGNPCTDEVCNGKTGKCSSVSSGAYCDDGDACSGGEQCKNGQCVGGKPMLCQDDGNPCTTEACQADVGCVSTPANGKPCKVEGGACQEGLCESGVCSAGAAGSCDDGKACTIDSCDKASGDCKHSAAKAGSACDDGSACTLNDACAGSDCKGKAADCDDGNPCSKDACDTAFGCSHAPNDGAACDDGDKCSAPDSCVGGGCVAGPAKACDGSGACAASTCEKTTGACVNTGVVAGDACDDGDACTASDSCSAGNCVGTAKNCDDSSTCTTDACGADGVCLHTALTATCDDGDACTSGDGCVAGVCAGKTVSCDDGNPCTADSCDVAKGCATAFADGAGCDDSEPCTSADSCNGGVCGGSAISCNDGNSCTVDACVSGKGCVSSDGAGACDDGNACTTADACKAGACKGSDTSASCDDGNPCTKDACAPSVGCVHTALTSTPSAKAPCDDGNACTTGDACKAGACTGGTKVCDCSANSDCKDKGGNACLGALVCSAGACVADAASAVSCTDDGDACSLEACDPKTGTCGSTKLGDGAPCDADGSACTSGDACQKGVCTAGAKVGCDDGNPCTSDSCDAALGCKHAPAPGECADGNPCTLGDACDGGACKAGAGKDCDDAKPCTTDGCDAKTGACSHSDASGPCDDGDSCSVGDACKAGVCAAAGAKACDDGSACTKDSCEGAKGCVFTAITGACDDGDACTSGETCSSDGKCGSGKTKVCAAKACHTVACDGKSGECTYKAIFGCGGLCDADSDCPDDGNACTTVGCDKKAGKCVTTSVADGGKCDDGKHCTVGEVCGAGKCGGAKPKGCDDGNVCTWDVCSEAAKGCTTLVKGGGCSDGDGCTVGDVCTSGSCKSGATKVCNDWNPCTADSCDKADGKCVFKAIEGCAKTCAADKDCPLSQSACALNYCATDKSCKTKPEPNNTGCNDADACTGLDLCLNGLCAGLNAKSCDDSDVCTADSCDKKTGACAHVAGAGPCQDGDLCTANDVCEGGKCAPGAAKVCNDGSACTTDGCDSKTGKCVFAPVPGCGGNCTEDKHCGDNGNPCATPYCAANKKCAAKNKADNTLCDDGNACSAVSFCKAGKCAGANLKTCKDSDLCTDDGCDSKSGDCVFAPKTGGGCNDASYCTAADTCKNGTCVGVTKVCDDKNVCTLDSCNPATGGCVFTPIEGCGFYCGKDADCKDDGNPCTTETCVLKTKLCKTGFAAKTTLCSDGNPCTVGDTCAYANGKCYGLAAKPCGDDEVCTTDVCDPKTGDCNHVQNSLPCSDSDGCTLGDKCSGGKCGAGKTKVCSDNKPCTLDSCDKKTGACSYTPIGADGCCDVDKDCKDDGNACTVAYCDPFWKSCKHKAGNDKAQCSDGNACTAGETCASGKCVGGKPKSCDDDEVCTTDLCDPESGKCFAVFNNSGCSDGSKCTANSQCKDGKCPAGKPIVSCATKPCQSVACDAKTGACVYAPIPDCK